MPEDAKDTRPSGPDRTVTGRTPSDAAVDLFRDAVFILGKVAPYIVIAALVVFGIFKFAELEDAKLDAVNLARLDATKENRDEIQALKSMILADTEKLTALQSANVDSITKQIGLQQLVDQITSDQTQKIAKLSEEKENLISNINARERSLQDKLDQAAAADARLAELQQQNSQLQQNRDLLDATERVASDILAVLSNELKFVPTRDLWQIAERYEGGGYDHLGRDYGGNYYYGAFRLRGGLEMKEFIAFLERRNAGFADALNSAGGEEAAGRGVPQFGEQWRRLAQDREFATMQRDFITENAYRSVLVGCRLRGGIDLEARPVAVQAVYWAATVQHGEGGVVGYCRQSKAAPGAEPLGDKTLISNLYAWRAVWLDTQFAENNPLIKRLLRLRYALEESDAYEILAADIQN